MRRRPSRAPPLPNEEVATLPVAPANVASSSGARADRALELLRAVEVLLHLRDRLRDEVLELRVLRARLELLQPVECHLVRVHLAVDVLRVERAPLGRGLER